MPELTPDDRAAGFTRIDPATGERLKAGWMTRAELAAHLGRMNARWRAWAFGPRPEGEGWTRTDSVGWVRSKTKGSSK